jgi:hypothetical protein
MDRYGGAGRPGAVAEAYGPPYRLDRVKDGDKARSRPRGVGSAAASIPTAGRHGAGGRRRGSRPLHLRLPDPAPPRRPTEVPATRAALARLRRIADLGERAGPLPFAPAAADQLQGWREDVAGMEGGAAGLFLSWLGKLPGFAVRLALVLEFLRWSGLSAGAPEPGEVGEAATMAALGLLEGYFVPMARRAFGDAAWPEAERDAAALARWIAAQRPVPERVNARELRHKAVVGAKEATRFDRALAELAEAGWVRPAPDRAGDTAGRARKDWEVNPALGGRRERPPRRVPGATTPVPLGPTAPLGSRQHLSD